MTVYPGAVNWSDDGWEGDAHGDGIDACSASDMIKDGMEGNDYSDIDGVTNAEYRNTDADCGMIVSGANIIVQPQDDDDSGVAFGIFAAAAACLIALAFLIAHKLRRKPREFVREDISLISNSLDGSLNDRNPYASTIDVHKCTSIYCNCNSKSNETTFLPAPKRVDMAKTLAANGISPTAVNEADDLFFNQDESDGPELDQAANLEHQGSNESRGSIMRVPIRSQYEENDGRPLTPVNEVLNDSELDSEMESVAGDDTTIPPPPPLAFHPAYRQGPGAVHLSESNDEISI